MFPWFSHGLLMVFLSKPHGWWTPPTPFRSSVGFGADPRDLDETPGGRGGQGKHWKGRIGPMGLSENVGFIFPMK